MSSAPGISKQYHITLEKHLQTFSSFKVAASPGSIQLSNGSKREIIGQLSTVIRSSDCWMRMYAGLVSQVTQRPMT